MLLTDAVGVGQFLKTYWQRQSLLLPGGLKETLPTIDGDELGWLATQPDVESRIVFTERATNKTSYQVEHGPFESTYLQDLPNENWTLLVQDVEKHLPDFRIWFDLVPFIPSWRLDDLMVSFAAPGGSVGPHADNYDVFLCQGEGTRTWRLGDGETATADTKSEELALLREFDAVADHQCVSGDVLYVPPGVPHWGIADDCCVTYSIGMRAPTDAELYAGAERIFGTNSKNRTKQSRPRFYSDQDLTECEAQVTGISIRAIERLREQKLLSPSLTNNQLAKVLGSVVTDPKSWLDPEPTTMERLQRTLPLVDGLAIHGMARLATYSYDDEQFAFLNGESCAIDAACQQWFEKAAIGRQLPKSEIVGSEVGNDFLAWMSAHGAFDLPESPE